MIIESEAGRVSEPSPPRKSVTYRSPSRGRGRFSLTSALGLALLLGVASTTPSTPSVYAHPENPLLNSAEPLEEPWTYCSNGRKYQAPHFDYNPNFRNYPKGQVVEIQKFLLADGQKVQFTADTGNACDAPQDTPLKLDKETEDRLRKAGLIIVEGGVVSANGKHFLPNHYFSPPVLGEASIVVEGHDVKAEVIVDYRSDTYPYVGLQRVCEEDKVIGAVPTEDGKGQKNLHLRRDCSSYLGGTYSS